MNARLPENPSVTARLAALRDAMAREGVAAYVVPSADPHLSEYLPERWQARRWLSGFTGSVGLLVVTADFAGMWVDSRYWVQAEAQLQGSGIDVVRIQTAMQISSYIDWLAQHLPAGAVVGADGAVLGVASAQQLEAGLRARGIALRDDLDLIDAVWEERPALPTAPVYEHLPPHATVSRADKLARLREAMREHQAQWHFVSTLDDIAWIFNLRGSDVSYNPVFCAHALIGLTGATLFLADGKVSAELAARLAQDGVTLGAYERAGAALAALPESALLIDPRRVTAGLLRHVPKQVRLVEAINPSVFEKSRKTAEQTVFIREAMAQDGAALAEFFAWFEAALARGEVLTELSVDEHLTAARARRPGYISPSFATIAGFNANGAMPHYRALPEAHARIEGNGLLLIDSGGQYLGGTTDITRVMPVGQVSEAQQRDFTLVLKSMMALSRARYPRGVRPAMLDAIARAPMWAAGLDYGHGTGHGVGYFLNVHEPPQVLSYYAAAESWNIMQEGQITSIEPGVYRPGQWGIRIENLVMNRAAGVTEFGDFLDFETLTLCPIDTRCVLPEMLGADERDWLNSYHATVRERVSPLLTGEALTWLETRTQPI